MKSVLAVLVSLFAFSTCSVPNLEPKSCIEARGELKKLYSLHFDRGFDPDERYRKDRDEYLSNRLKSSIDAGEEDYLTQTADHPKAFRIGECGELAERVQFEILLFWKDDSRDEQREILVDMVRDESVWKVDRVSSRE
ncbi:MAG: hypothetical protein DWQ47_15150 [Acidobacteria bacterium]|nr:MAG: hypothetical protein DWQ32_02550 [Acidobacteriota bacterium]REK02599.1 MAG: hypothetical protein DWQ38_09585 [Acidobacteriota bacterium]REK13598.1 MAG: hypothetical protein DWQ43_08240 [Acidobacteriota bacterium]REK41592.1 MAG: hypothetical protein DWQ47_15150 [Acidobacteriota bacterium]